MPLNLLKRYNDLLEIDHMGVQARMQSLAGIFKRDFIEHVNELRGKNVHPIFQDGLTTMEVLFKHLTTQTENNEKHREYDRDRSIRIHWIRHHLSERTPGVVDVFSVNDPNGVRTYIYDRNESYVVILEPKKEGYYYLLTAYYVRGGNKAKIERKFKRKLPELF